MKATFISREKNDVKFTMEFTAEEFENAQIKAVSYTHLSRLSERNRREIQGAGGS